MNRMRMYGRTILIWINWEGEPSGYLDFSLKIGYIGSLKFGSYCLQYVPRLNLSTTPDLKF